MACWYPINSDGTAPDWAKEIDIPTGQYTAVSVGADFACGLKVDQAVACWGENGEGQLDAPLGSFTAVSSGFEHSCGLRTDQAILCWGNDKHGELDVPEGRYTAVAAGHGFSCAVEADQSIVCWGSEEIPDPRRPGDPPIVDNQKGNFRDFYVPNAYHELDAPAGQFTAVSASQKFACGLRVDAAIICWGNVDKRQDPNGRIEFMLISKQPRNFVAISTTSHEVCGLRADGSAECYELGEYIYHHRIATTFQYPITGQYNVLVYYCTSEGSDFTATELNHEVDWLNQTVGKFYSRESSERATLRFLPGDILMPDLRWEDPELMLSYEGGILDVCNPHDEPSFDQNWREDYIILIDHPEVAYNQFATNTHAVIVTRNQQRIIHCFPIPSCSIVGRDSSALAVADRTYALVAGHEIGHAVFDFAHPPDCSIMGLGYNECPINNYRYDPFESIDELLSVGYVGCRDRRFAGWEEDGEICREPWRRPLWYLDPSPG